MDTMLKAAAVAVIGAVLAVTIKKQTGDMSALLSIAVCTVLGVAALTAVRPAVSFMDELRQTAGLSTAVTAPLIKSVGVGILTSLTACFCADAGQSAAAKMVELCGGAVTLLIALPLMSAVLELLRELML